MGRREDVLRNTMPFWTFQTGFWVGYGLLLMLPWIGAYTVASMVPNKIAIAGSGLLTSSILRLIYDRSLRESRLSEQLILLVAVSSVLGGVVWSAASGALVNGSALTSVSRFGFLEGGLPRLNGPLYHALVLLTWSLIYLSGRSFRADGGARRIAHGVKQNAGTIARSIFTAAEGRLVARDGGRTIMLERDEVDWIAAEGDYVRLHSAGKTLLIRSTMRELESSLRSPQYVRIHRSTIVNVSRVRETLAQPNSELVVVLRDGTKLRASRSYADGLRAAIGLRGS